MSGHTPGPWDDVHRPRQGRRLHIGVVAVDDVANDSFFIASCPGPDGKANARLIAAAPELLAELIALRKRFQNAVRATGSDDEIAAMSTPGADAAIAKATES